MNSRPEGAATRLGMLFAGAALAAALANPAFAQQAAAPTPAPAAAAPAAKPAAAPAASAQPEEDEAEVEELVVVGTRTVPRGSVVSDIKAEQTLDPGQIRALGASSVSELLDALAPQLESNQGRGGRPVTLVNGARISSFNEIRDLPPEAIQRVEIFPEELSLQYGYRAEQKVVNFVLRRRFRATTTEAGVKVPSAGGTVAYDADANRLQIQRDDRLQIDVKAGHTTSLLESERDLISRAASRPFDPVGNVTASPFVSGAEIDPALSALAGRTVTVAPVPANVTGALPLSAFTGLPNATDISPYRTLIPQSDSLAINGVLVHPFGGGVSGTINATAEWNQSNALLGLSSYSLTVPPAAPFSPFDVPVEIQRYAFGNGPLARRGETLTGHLSGSLLGAVKGWNWTLNASADRTQTESVTDRGVDVSALQARVTAHDPTINVFAQPDPSLLFWRAPDTAKSIETTAEVEGLANGRIADLPAGGLMGSFTAGLSTDRLSSDSFRSGLSQSVDLDRQIGRVAGNLVFPIASVRNDVLKGLGDLTLNVNAEIDHLSDFGDIKTLGGGIRWQPWTPVRVIASYTHDENAPTIQQLGNPLIVTPAVRVFDFTTGQTVEVNQLSGGNATLGGETRGVWKLGLELKPWSQADFALRADYTKTEIHDEIAGFPGATAEIQAAFPERFVRDASGRLSQVDFRPVNFASHDTSALRWGFNYSKRLGPQRPAGGFPGRGNFQRPGADGAAPTGGPPPADGAAPAAEAPSRPTASGDQAPAGGERRAAGPDGGGFGGPGGGGFRGGGGRGGFGGPGGPGAGSFQVSLFDTWRLTDEVLIRPGVPVLDFLNGAAAGNGGGTPEHQVDLQAAIMKSGLGARLNARWVTGTQVIGGTAGEDLRFSDLTTVSLRLFADLGQRPFARQHPFFRGARVALSFDNLFDQKLDVKDAAGVTPVNFQPDLIDPLGRTVRLSFRKIFF